MKDPIDTAMMDPAALGGGGASIVPQRPQLETVGPSPLPAGTRLQEFDIRAVIGQGGFGIVYLARDLSLQRPVAIKEYMPAHLAGRDASATVRPLTAGQSQIFELGRRSFINEARMLARFKHPGLVEVLRFWQQNGTAYMAMPYYDGATLTEFLRRNPRVATQYWLRATLTPLLDALEHMHAEDCYHRDVAPDNILVLKDGTAVLLDLGAARRVIGDDAQAMTILLKPGFAPIEQYSDDPRFRQGPWTDIYAMAAVLYFAVTGRPPPASASRVMRDSVAPLAESRPAGFSLPFLRAIDRGLSLQPDDRPRSIAEFRAALWAEDSPVTATPAAKAPRAEPVPAPTQPGVAPDAEPSRVDARRRPSRRLPLVGGALAALAVVTAGWMALQPTDPPAQPVAQPVAQGTVKPAGAPEAAMDAAETSASSKPQAARDPAMSAQADATGVASSTKSTDSTNSTDSMVATDAAAATAPARPRPTKDVPRRPAAEPARMAPAPAAPAAPAVAASAAGANRDVKPPAAGNGTLRLAIKPWAEIRVDGAKKGVSPPLKDLALTAGRHTIELRNPAAAPVTRVIDVQPGRAVTISHQF